MSEKDYSNEKVVELAKRLDDFMYEYDPYEYQDTVGIKEINRIEERESIERSIRNGEVKAYIDTLTRIIEEGNQEYDGQAKGILKEIFDISGKLDREGEASTISERVEAIMNPERSEEPNSPFTLHIKYKEPKNMNGFIVDKDSIVFGSIEEMNKYINGEVAYNELDDSVKRKDDEILMYAENSKGEVVWGAYPIQTSDITDIQEMKNTIPNTQNRTRRHNR